MSATIKWAIGSFLAIGFLISGCVSAPKTDTNDEEEKWAVIDAPFTTEKGGYGYYIPKGSIIYHSKGMTTVYSSDGKVLLRADDSKAKKIFVPAGVEVPATHVYQDVSRSEITSFSFTTEEGKTITTEQAEKIYGAKGELLYIVISG